MGLPFPEEYGGAGADTVSYALAVMEIARADASTAITMAAHVSLGATPFSPLRNGGAEAEVPRSARTRREALGLRPDRTERGQRRRQRADQAELRDGNWVVNGTKAFITNSGTDITGGTTITAVTGKRPDGSREISNIIVPQETPGFSRSRKYRKMGWRASDTRELSFVDAAVPEENLLGARGEGYRQFLTILDGGRISVAALSIGLAYGSLRRGARLLAKNVTRSASRSVSFRRSRSSSSTCSLEIEHAKLMMLRAAWEKDRGRDYVQPRPASLSSSPASFRIASSTKRCKFTAATVSWTSIRSRACIATRRSTRSAKGPTKFSV